MVKTKALWVIFVQCLMLGIVVLSLSMLLPAAAQEESAEEEYSVGAQLVAEGLTAPVAMAFPDDGSGRLFVADQAGKIWIIASDGTLQADPFLDLSGLIVTLRTDYDERGVLGMAFHPDYANNGRFFVYYTTPLRDNAPAGWSHTNTLAEFNVSLDNPNLGDLGTQKYILQIDQPQFNHDSGHITFGPDGYLYFPIGDGGGANDTDEGHTPDLGNGQDTTNLHGSILRLDVNGTPGEYTIPADNPYVDQEGVAPEIFAYGFRNPFHISFDMGGENQLFVADAGQNEYEEVSIVTSGGNYGWNIKEGTHCFNAEDPDVEITDCASTGANGEPLVDPVIEYDHSVGVVVVGGYVYRGSTMADLGGYYIFGDYTKSFEGSPDGTLLWAEPSEDGSAMWTWGELKVAGMDNERIGAFVLAIGQGPDGELYVMTSESLAPAGDTGKVWKLMPSGEAPTSDTGAESDTNTESDTSTESDANTGSDTTAPSGSGGETNATEEPSG